jgi:hypothetical protein
MYGYMRREEEESSRQPGNSPERGNVENSKGSREKRSEER